MPKENKPLELEPFKLHQVKGICYNVFDQPEKYDPNVTVLLKMIHTLAEELEQLKEKVNQK